MKSKLHAMAGVIALLTIAAFWTSTLLSEIFGNQSQIAAVKSAILSGMLVLIPAMALVGSTGFSLGKTWHIKQVATKRRRMKIVAANGLLVLLPCAFFLASRAQVLMFDGWFYGVQTPEIIAGALNLVLLSLNMRDGLMLSRRNKLRVRRQPTQL
jgi:hypothetical protein